ncbi:DNA polymerase III subunit delta [Tepidimonas alkaliphilus]|uniref:DNA polymerase III subunit delta n=1 Tax=Tepidimonas alkaliphilus TaxID=2588942 RepID=A0A554W770_9BURK|nr:DNA polymerase III subunit delta [Tepidimonas alkaliphilus]TSE19415.1 DNA polymerase III subunit delta [Tepidimonas alkaliphilus]
MQVSPTELPAQLQRGLRSLYVVNGDEALLTQEACDAIRAAARAAGCSERTVFTVNAAQADWSAILAAGAERSLFAQRRLVEIRIPSGKPGKDGAEALQRLAPQAAASPDTVTLVVLPRLDGAALKSAWFAALAEHGVAVRVEPVERAQLPGWIAQRLQAQGQHVAAGEEGLRTLAFIAERVEGNLLAAHQEIAKLGLLYPAGELSFEQVRAAVLDVARFDPFRLPEAVLDGALARAQRMLEGLRGEGVAPVPVHWALAEELRLLHRARLALEAGQPLPLVLRHERLWGPRERRVERVLPRLSSVQTGGWVVQAHEVDGVIKGLAHPDWPADPWQALTRLALGVAAGCARAQV